MKDSYSREINYLIISLSDKCNLRCVYCKSEDDKCEEDLDDILSLDDFKFLIKSFAEFGINKVKFVGGEPLLYPYLKELIYFAKYECKIDEVSIATNGHHFCENAIELKKNGLDSIDLGIDSLKSYKYNAVTRGGNLNEALNTLNTCERLKIKVKVNCVLIEEFNTDELHDFIRLAKYNEVDVRFMELVPWGISKELYKYNYVNTKLLMESIDEVDSMNYEEESSVKYYKINNLKGRVGIISPSSPTFCNDCNKIMITHDGFIRLCYFADEEISLRDFIHKPIMFKEVIKNILMEKPRAHELV